MRYLVSAEEMKRMDNNTSERLGVSGMVLMERAALAARELILEYLRKKGLYGGTTRLHGNQVPDVLIMAGIGNNGGDGLALARLLAERDVAVSVWCVGNREKASAQWTAGCPARRRTRI